MTVNDAITKLRVMLGASSEEVIKTTVNLEEDTKEEEVSTKMAEATLVDGTKVYTEGELAVGAVLYVSTEEEEDPFAPSALHETSEGLLITVGENGEITSIEEKATDAVSEEVVEEVELEEEVIEETKVEAFDAEGLLAAIAELVKEYRSEVREELEALTERFNKIADEPATKPVRNNFTKEAAENKSTAEARYEKLVSIRRGK